MSDTAVKELGCQHLIWRYLFSGRIAGERRKGDCIQRILHPA